MAVRADRDRPLKWFLETVPEAAFDEAMALSGDKRFYRLYDAFHDDAYRNTSPGTLCRRFGISMHDLFCLWCQYNRDLALVIMANHLPKIGADIAEDAMRHEVACSRCDGIGTLRDGHVQRTCPMCKGAGQVWVPRIETHGGSYLS
jgi:hypothetical protein